jgi:hypothetical protein
MPHDIVEHRPMRVNHSAALIVGGLLVGALLSGCSSPGDNPFTVFADPGKYQFHDCQNLAAMRIFWKRREDELKLLMDKGERSTGGAVVNVIAYKSEYVAAQEELKVLDATARSKNCPPPK